MRLEGANASARIEGEDQLPGVVNYFIGNDSSQWRAGIPTYARVKYRQVYPGIDLVYYGNHSQLECDLNLAPGAKPEQIRLSFRGADHLEIDRDGDLVVGAPRDRIVIHRPIAYQDFNGARRKVASSYKMLGRSRVGVEVASYDRSKPLTIDPTLSYATFMGGSFIDEADALAVDSTGSAYITGFTCSADFPIAPGTSVPQPDFGGLCDAFVTKLSPDGSQFVYSTYLGGSGSDRGNGIAVDQSGAVYLTGTTSGHFPVTAGAAQTAYGGGSSDAFVSKISADGSTLIYSTYLGGEAIDSGQAIAVPQGCSSGCDAFAVGYTLSFRFPATRGGFPDRQRRYRRCERRFHRAGQLGRYRSEIRFLFGRPRGRRSLCSRG